MSEQCGDCGAKITPDNRVWDGDILRCEDCAEKCGAKPVDASWYDLRSEPVGKETK